MTYLHWEMLTVPEKVDKSVPGLLGRPSITYKLTAVPRKPYKYSGKWKKQPCASTDKTVSCNKDLIERLLKFTAH